MPRSHLDYMMSLHMNGQTVCFYMIHQNEIALYVLCKMYYCHCVVITSAKLWTTIECDTPVTEEFLLENADLHLLYIEPGVFGELRPKPAMPLALQQTPLLESATEILPPQTWDGSEKQPSPLNLCISILTPTIEKGIGDNTDGNAGRNASDKIMLHQSNISMYADASLSGALDHLHLDTSNDLDFILAQFLVHTENDEPEPNQATDDIDPEFPIFTETENSMLDCVVCLDTLTDDIIAKWTRTGSSKYFLHTRQSSTKPRHFARKAKQDVVYNLESGFSSHDDFSVKPGQWCMPRLKNISAP